MSETVKPASSHPTHERETPCRRQYVTYHDDWYMLNSPAVVHVKDGIASWMHALRTPSNFGDDGFAAGDMLNAVEEFEHQGWLVKKFRRADGRGRFQREESYVAVEETDDIGPDDMLVFFTPAEYRDYEEKRFLHRQRAKRNGGWRWLLRLFQ